MSEPNGTNNIGSKGSTGDKNQGAAEKSPWLWTLAYTLAGIATAVVVIRLWPEKNGFRESFGAAIPWAMLWAILFFGAVYFVQIFTNPILEADKAKGPKQNWFAFSYAFMLFALFASILPFVIENARDLKYYEIRPIGVFRGCVEDPEGVAPAELRCNLGEAKDQPATGATNGSSSTPTQQPNAQGDKSKVPHAMWIINVGGQLVGKEGKCGTGCYSVRGGLVVPLYIVIFALIGGAISLTRRVPEYQKQAEPDFKQTEADHPRLELPVVREYLVFEMVQYLSAPFIAVAAYYVIRPTDTSSSVALAFIAGFASEAVLLMIRGVVDKVAPKLEKLLGGGSVSVDVKDAKGESVEGATVKVIGQPGLTAKTSKDRPIIFEHVPVGEHAIEVKHTGEPIIQVVSVSEGRPTPCHIKMKV